MFKEDASGLAVRLTRKEQQSSPTKRKATGKRTGGRPTPKTPTRGMEFQSKKRREKESAATSGSTTDSGSSTSENLAPSTKRVNQKTTREAKQHQSKKTTRRSNRASVSTNAIALGDPIPINTVGVTLQSPTKKLSIDSPSDKQTNSQEIKTPEKTPPSSLKYLITEMGFQEESPEYKACLTFLDAIRPKDQTSTTQIVDLVSPAETPEKSPANLEILSEMNVQNVEKANYEEHQEKANTEEQSAEKL